MHEKKTITFCKTASQGCMRVCEMDYLCKFENGFHNSEASSKARNKTASEMRGKDKEEKDTRNQYLGIRRAYKRRRRMQISFQKKGVHLTGSFIS